LLAVAKTELDMSLDIFFDLTVTHRKNWIHLTLRLSYHSSRA